MKIKSKNSGFLEESLTESPAPIVNGVKKLKSKVTIKKIVNGIEPKKIKSNGIVNGKKKLKKLKKKVEIEESDKNINEIEPPVKVKKAKKKKQLATTEEVIKKSEKKTAQNHKAALNKLKHIDPEFYKFLEQNDKKLLNFNAENEDSDGDEDEEKPDDIGDDDDEDVHKPLTEFDVASDESDFEAEDDDADEIEEAKPKVKGGTQLITLKLLKQWQQDLVKDKVTIETIKNVIDAVNSALLSISGDHVTGLPYKVEGAAVFNGVLQLCVLHLHPAIKQYLGLVGQTSRKPHKCKKWNKIRTPLKDYLTDLTKLLEHVSSSNILIVLLKHLHQISPMVGSFTSLTKPILKRLVTLWSTSEETVRVLAFLSIVKITRGQPTSFLNTILKPMYLSYVRNSKFISPATLPSINFMRRSLTEMFALDLNVSYQHVFLYIRQLAIHLRNALTLKKKDSYQSVYNWQFINSLRLWVELLSATSSKKQLHPLIYPLVSIITGTIKLIPTAQYFPLRFHCIQILIQLSKETRTFIPVMPYILEVLHSETFNKKHSKVSMKPLSFTCILRLNNEQLQENGFRDEVIECIFATTLDYMAHESFTLSYPDLVVPSIINLKQYVKRCRNSNHSRKLKQLIDKLDENYKLVETEREKISFTLKDTALIAAWETTLRNKGTPLLVYYTNWVRTHFNVKKRQATDSDNINDYNLPTINRKTGVHKGASDGPVELFPTDDEDEELELEKPIAKKQKHENTKIVPVPTEEESNFIDDGVDIVKDLDLDDW